LSNIFGGAPVSQPVPTAATPILKYEAPVVVAVQKASSPIHPPQPQKLAVPSLSLDVSSDSAGSWEVVEEPVMYIVEGIFEFRGGKSDDLSFNVGEKIEVLREHGDWLFGRKLGSKDANGWFPLAFTSTDDGKIAAASLAAVIKVHAEVGGFESHERLGLV